MRALLDVNALIAMLDPEHMHHVAVHGWLESPENKPHGFATCALSQLGFIRITAARGYPHRVEPGIAARLLEKVTRKGHRYLEIPQPAESAIRWGKLKSEHVTDASLLSTAVAHGCRLVTFDAGIAPALVAGATKDHLVVLRAMH